LIELAREIDGVLRLPDFSRRFVLRAAELTGARAGALALFQDGRFQTVALYPSVGDASSEPVGTARQTADLSVHGARAGNLAESRGQARSADDRRSDRALDRSLSAALDELVTRHTQTVVSGSAAELLGAEIASTLAWDDCTVVRLPGSNGELAGLL
jgi:hypothetical protein